jgi:hypothetical protein
MTAGIKANVDGSAAIQVGGTDYITISSAGAVAIPQTFAVTGVTTVQAGTAAAPSITFSGDTNTGIYSPGADRIGFAEGGTQVGEFDASANFLFNSGYGSVAIAYGCRAWVNFNGTAAGTFAGGVSTVTRIAGSTTATVTTTTAHGLLTGSVVYALTGVAAGTYTVTFISATQFSFTTVATTALTAASITFAVSSIRSSGNVSSVADLAVGTYTVNFTTAMPDINYSAVGSSSSVLGSAIMVSTNSNGLYQPQAPTTTACQLQTTSYTANQDCAWVSLAFFR